jgi:hypothetical protein
MRPWQHAVSSARSQRPWQQDLEIHEFLDSTKLACADRRHRLVLHSVDLGLALAHWAFPDRPEVESIVRQHVDEDLGMPATLAQWLDGCEPELLPRPLSRRIAVGREGVVALVAGKIHPSCEAAVGQVYDLLTLPAQLAPDHHVLTYAVLMNAFGPGLVRRLFGPPQRVDHAHGQATVDWAWIAEAIIFTMYGRIPDLGELVRSCSEEPMRSGAAMRVRSHGL